MLLFNQEQIQFHINQIVSCITTNLEAKSIILLGSAARDELSVRVIANDRIELFSDYECMVVVEKRPSVAQRQSLQAQLNQLEEDINNPNPLFHIDVIVREEKRLKALQPIIFTYEMKANGKVLYGEDILNQVPTVTLANLDRKNTNEILYKRLWALLLHLPDSFIAGEQMSMRARRVAGYILCRNALDITTVLLPHEDILLPTYRQRVAEIEEKYAMLNLSMTFGKQFPLFLQKCLDLRQTLQFEDIDLFAWYRETITFLRLALNQIGFDADSPPSAKIFNEWPISRGEGYNLVRIIQRQMGAHGLSKTTQWLRTSKKYQLTTGLLEMHQAVIVWQAGDTTTAVKHLQRSQRILDTLQLDAPKLTESDFLQDWFVLRQNWAEFWRRYIRLNDPKYIDRFKKITTWDYGADISDRF